MTIDHYVNKVICADSLQFMKKLPDKCVDLVVTSPPYNCGIKYINYNDNIEWLDYYKWCTLWLNEIFRVMKDDGRFALIHYLSLGQSGNRHAPLMKLNTICEDIGFKHHGLAIWWDITLTKRTAWGSWLSSSAPYVNSPFEGVLILYKERWKRDNKGKTIISKEEFMESCSGVWKIGTERDRTHPAPFPVKMADRCIKLLSYEDDIILDPFAGSFTTAISCINNKRNFICIEKELKYCSIGFKRIKKIMGDYSE
jgi:site-specific DNA-methyltransferase (adenine-specific)